MTDLLLFLCYYGPEENTTGIRVGRLARGAVRAGLRAVIVHADRSAREYRWRDDIPVVTFRRTDPSGWRDRRRPTLTDHANDVGVSTYSLASRIARRLARIILQPDEMVLSVWPFIRAGVRVGRKQAAHHRVMVIASGPVWTTFLVGRSVSRRLRAPLVLDYQDLWSSNPVARWTPFAHLVARGLERRVTRGAQAALFVNEGIAERVTDLWPWLGAGPHEIAPIAFETPASPRLHLQAKTDLRIGYFGSVYRGRSIMGLLRGCAAARSSTCRPTVHWFGQIMGDHPDGPMLPEYVEAGLLTLHDPVSHDAAMKEMRDCDLLVTIPSPLYREELTTKLYDYLEAGRPILALAVAQSLLSEFMTASQAGVCLAPDDIAGIAQFLVGCSRGELTLDPNQAFLEGHRLIAVTAALQRLVRAASDPLPA
jgi:hypothetical protein